MFIGILRKKIKSEEGASLAAALLFFIFSAVVCSILLASASAAAGRIKSIKETGQKDITLTSIENILMGKLDTIKKLDFTHQTEPAYEPEYADTFEDDIREQISALYYELYPEGEIVSNWDNIIEEKKATLLPVDDRTGIWRKLEYEMEFDGNTVEIVVYIFADFHIEVNLHLEDDVMGKRFVKYGTIKTNSVRSPDGYEIRTKIRFEDCVDVYV